MRHRPRGSSRMIERQRGRSSGGEKGKNMLKLFSFLILLSAVPLAAQNTSKSIFLTNKSNIPSPDISKSLRKKCPNVSVTSDVANSDYTLEALKTTSHQGIKILAYDSFDLTLSDREGIAFGTSADSLGDAMKNLCRAIRRSIVVEVVDTQNLTQSVDVRGDTSGGAVAAAINGATGRRTHTDASTIYVVVNGERALLDCYERRTGCATVGPGKYYGERDGDGIWVSFQMPLIHRWARNHYKIAGSW
jgi:hypothetical protein